MSKQEQIPNIELVRLLPSKEDNIVIFGLTQHQWREMITFIHKAEVFVEWWEKGKKPRGQEGQMNKIIMDSVCWTDLGELENAIRLIIQSFDNAKQIADKESSPNKPSVSKN